MIHRSLVLGIVAALALGACESIPQGPALTYEQLLPNTHENPTWARASQPHVSADQLKAPPAAPR